MKFDPAGGSGAVRILFFFSESARAPFGWVGLRPSGVTIPGRCFDSSVLDDISQQSLPAIFKHYWPSGMEKKKNIKVDV